MVLKSRLDEMAVGILSLRKVANVGLGVRFSVSVCQSTFARLAKNCSVTSRCHTDEALESIAKMALAGKSGFVGNIHNRHIAFEMALRRADANTFEVGVRW